MKPLWWYLARLWYWILYVLGIDRKMHPATNPTVEHL